MPIQAEPYVEDPAEPRKPPMWWRLRPLVSILAALLVVGAVAFLAYESRARQDPALDSSVEELQAP